MPVWYVKVDIDDVVNLTNCSFNYYSIIFNRLTQYGLSDDQYQSYKKFYNQLRIKGLRRIKLNGDFNIMSGYPSNYFWFGHSSFHSISGFMARYLFSEPMYKCSLDIECYSGKYSDTDTIYIGGYKKVIPKTSDKNNDKNGYLSSKLLKRKKYRQNLPPKYNKIPKMKIYGKQCHR